MNDRLKKAFDQIQADDALKQHTRKYLFQTTNGYHRQNRFSPYRKLVTAMACLLLVVLGWNGYAAYFTPSSSISIDVNPSFELNVNRFGKVLNAEAFNEDGSDLLADINIRFQDYTDVLGQILSSEKMAQYLTSDSLVAITVCGKNSEQSDEILTNVTTCTSSYGNVHCSSGNYEDSDTAHHLGMSCGKYKAYLILQSLDENTTPEEVKDMTMRQIWNRIEELSGDAETYFGCGHNSGHYGNHKKQHGHGHD